MRLNRAEVFRLPLLIFGMASLLSYVASQPGPARAQVRQQQVKIYLAREVKDGEPFDSNNPGNLHPVMRRVNAGAPMRPALKALLEGPTAAEKAQGYYDISFGIKLVGVKIKDGAVRADFTMPPGAAFSGDNSPFYFRDAVQFTIKQFPGIRKVIVCLDGLADFWSEDDSPPKRCPRL